ncbi:1-acyl-sn-glycerol-3-phosphate acyltransferase [Microbispora sp. RL4-1S]|uniref:1-acyl-sn-glycerol-3-phosphate acyltransferase n=1 Tax=Microbispora oryzae TaxID=2806554 RepID=A0A940WLQ6_9ACTN|nr:lysophospholipid acyltransferase family protein [Microbispora oryzae]MBP2707258.1 1-acyl-sn-glycerol-3-phosphate acyltransferase [Microbispora oryzae]
MSAIAHLPVTSSPWTPLSPCTPDCVGEPAAVVGPVRRGLRLTATVLTILAGIPLALVLCRSGTARRMRWTMLWSRLLLRALGVRIETRRGFAFVGGPTDVRAVPDEQGPALLVCNHVSWLDPLIMAATNRCRPLAKSEVSRWPLIGMLATAGGALFIDRERLSTLPRAVADVAAALRDGDSVAAFPEGTTWCGRQMGAFRPAVFQAAIDAGVPVRPLALRFRQGEGLCTCPCYVGDDSLTASIRRVVALRGLVAEVTAFPAVRLARPAPSPEARRTLAYTTEAYVRTALTGHERRAAAA